MKFDKQLTAALAEGDEVLAERRRIGEAIDRTAQLQSEAEGRLQTELEKLAAEEATAALEGTAEVTAGVSAVRTLRDALEALGARILGLKNRLTQTDDAVLRAADNLTMSRERFIAEQRETFCKEYRVAAEVFAGVLRRGYGLSRALGMEFASNNIRLPEPITGEGDAVEIFERKLVEGAGWVPAWQSDPAARQAYDAATAPREAAERIDAVAQTIREERERQARREDQARMQGYRPQTPGLAAYRGPDGTMSPAPAEYFDAKTGRPIPREYVAR